MMQILRRALVLGVAFGFATALVEVWLGMLPFIERRFGPGPFFTFAVRAAPDRRSAHAARSRLAAPLLAVRRGVARCTCLAMASRLVRPRSAGCASIRPGFAMARDRAAGRRCAAACCSGAWIRAVRPSRRLGGGESPPACSLAAGVPRRRALYLRCDSIACRCRLRAELSARARSTRADLSCSSCSTRVPRRWRSLAATVLARRPSPELDRLALSRQRALFLERRPRPSTLARCPSHAVRSSPAAFRLQPRRAHWRAPVPRTRAIRRSRMVLERRRLGGHYHASRPARWLSFGFYAASRHSSAPRCSCWSTSCPSCADERLFWIYGLSNWFVLLIPHLDPACDRSLQPLRRRSAAERDGILQRRAHPARRRRSRWSFPGSGRSAPSSSESILRLHQVALSLIAAAVVVPLHQRLRPLHRTRLLQGAPRARPGIDLISCARSRPARMRAH